MDFFREIAFYGGIFYAPDFIILLLLFRKRAFQIRPNIATLALILGVSKYTILQLVLGSIMGVYVYSLVAMFVIWTSIMAIIRFVLFLFIREKADKFAKLYDDKADFVFKFFVTTIFAPLLSLFMLRVWTIFFDLY